MIKPKQLKHGSHIGVISPSYWFEKEDISKTMGYFEKKGSQLNVLIYILFD